MVVLTSLLSIDILVSNNSCLEDSCVVNKTIHIPVKGNYISYGKRVPTVEVTSNRVIL